MSDPPQTPAWHTQSFWTGMVKLCLEGAALATGISAIPAEVPPKVYSALVIAAILKFAGSLLGQLAAFFVREGVSSVDKRADVAATVAVELAERVAQNESGFTADLIREGNALPSTPPPGSQAEDRTGRGERA
jgi:hypothetical protein